MIAYRICRNTSLADFLEIGRLPPWHFSLVSGTITPRIGRTRHKHHQQRLRVRRSDPELIWTLAAGEKWSTRTTIKRYRLTKFVQTKLLASATRHVHTEGHGNLSDEILCRSTQTTLIDILASHNLAVYLLGDEKGVATAATTWQGTGNSPVSDLHWPRSMAKHKPSARDGEIAQMK